MCKLVAKVSNNNFSMVGSLSEAMVQELLLDTTALILGDKILAGL